MNNYILQQFLRTLPNNVEIRQVLNSILVTYTDNSQANTIYRFDEATGTFVKDSNAN